MSLSISRVFKPSLGILLFIVSPILSIPYMLRGVAKGNKVALFLAASVLGLAAYLTIPISDLYRHTMNYYEMVDNGAQISLVLFQNFDDFLVIFLSQLLVVLDLPFEYLRFFELTYCSCLLFLIYRFFILHNNYTEKQALKRFFIIVLFLEFIYTTSGLRFGLGMCNYIYGLHILVDKKNKLLSVGFFILACVSHLSFTFLIPITLILTVYAMSFRRVLVAAIIVVIIGNVVLGALSSLMSVRADWYFGGGNSISGEGYSNLSIFGVIMLLVPRIFLFPFFVIAFKDKSIENWWKRTFFAWLILVATFVSNSIVLMRAFWGLEYVAMFMLLSIERYKRIKVKMINNIVACGILFTLINGINFRVYFYSHYERLILPVPVILSYNYTYDWVSRHIENNEIIRPIE